MTLIDPSKSRIQTQIQKLEDYNSKGVIEEVKTTTNQQIMQQKIPSQSNVPQRISDTQKLPLSKITEHKIQPFVTQTSQNQKMPTRNITTTKPNNGTPITRKPPTPLKKIESKITTSNNNFAFVDCQNLWYNLDKDWQLDWNKFFNYLKLKHGVKRGYVFIGFVAGFQKMYQQLQEAGFILIFKPVQETSNGIKCNVDTEMVLQTMIQLPNYDRAVIVSGDGDFTCLVDHLSGIGKLEAIMIPGQKSYSHSLEKAGKNRVVFISKLKTTLQKDAASIDDMPIIISE